MEDKEAIDILQLLLMKGGLDVREAEAVRTAIGVLSLTNNVADSHIASMRKRKVRDYSVE